MAERRVSTTIISDRWAYLWFVIGTVLSLFSTGQWNILLVSWVQPIFFIRFLPRRCFSSSFLFLVTSPP